MIEVVVEKILTKAAESAVSFLSDAVKRKNDELVNKYQQRRKKDPQTVPPARFSANIQSPRSVLQGALQQHIEEIKHWCAQIKFSDLRGAKSVLQVYVELDTYLMPLNIHEDTLERNQTEPLLDAIKAGSQHCVLLGTAGAGKTTSVQKICAEFFRQGKVFGTHNFPVLIKLREISGESEPSPVLTALRNALSLHVRFTLEGQDDDREFSHSVERKLLTNYLDDLNAVILLDGFDELATEELRERVMQEISFLTESLRHSRIIVTSRSSDFRYKLASVQKFEIAPLTPAQVAKFAERWLQSAPKAEDFLKKIFSSPFADTTIRPLTIAHLCAIYERIQDIPEKPKSVYRRIVQLLLEDWDSQRQIKRPSAYAKFDHDRKFDFLAHLAFFLTVELKQLRFSTSSLKEAYAKIHRDHGLPASQAVQVTGELESHSGLIIESGHGYFEFAHKSIQEYLAADYIVRLPSLELLEGNISLLPNELAIATSLSSRPSAFLAELFLKVIDLERESSPWLSTFLVRLGLEKPDLHVGASEYSAIAAMQLLTRHDRADGALKLLSAAFPSNTELLIRRFYEVSGKDSQYTRFRLITKSYSHRLPSFLRAPTDLLSRLKDPTSPEG